MPISEAYISVRNYHVDSNQHVNNARYFEFLEEGSWVYLEQNREVQSLLNSLRKKGIIHVLVSAILIYKSSAQLGDKLVVETKLDERTFKSFTWYKTIRQAESSKRVLDAKLTCVFIDTNSQKVIPISEQILACWPELAALKLTSYPLKK